MTLLFHLLIPTWLVYTYLSTNIFALGWIASFLEEASEQDTNLNPIMCGLLLIIALVIGGPILVFLYGHRLLRIIWGWLSVTFQIPFFFSFYFTKTFVEVDLKRLRTINRHDQSLKEDNWHNSIWHHCVEMINKRNNYNPSTDAGFALLAPTETN